MSAEDSPRRKILMVAYHFPPLAGSSGIQRTLRFVQHLTALGWQPIVLTASPWAYARTSSDLMADVPAEVLVKRSFALDTARHLALRGRYWGALALPDRWATWRFAAVYDGLQLIRRYRPEAIWSTYPIATAHVIGAELQRRSGLPWVADFRDPMVQEGYPADPRQWRHFQRIEDRVAHSAARVVFTTPGALKTYGERYPAAAARMALIENGYDEESFRGAVAPAPVARPDAPIVILHSGIVYPAERDPTQLFIALATLKAQALVTPAMLRLKFRAAAHDANLRALAARYQVEDFIELGAALPYREALGEMLAADALLILQDAGCNDQIPAKLYEYLRAGRPILGLTDPRGDTAHALRQAGLNAIAALEDAAAITALLPNFLAEVRAGRASLPQPQAVASASRLARTHSLIGLLDDIKKTVSA